MSNIGDALKRKLGPLPAWAWAILGFGLVWYYRNKLSSASSTSTSSTTPATVPPTLAPVTLAPGESVYDPNTGLLTNTPDASQPNPGDTSGSTSSTGGNGTDLGQAIEDLVTAMENQPQQSGGTTNNYYSSASSGAKKVTSKSTKRTTKAKPKVKATKVKTGKGILRKRSTASIKRPSHVTTTTKASTRGRPRTISAAATKSRTRTKPTIPVRKQVTNQRPVASHPARPPVAHNTPHQQTTQRRVTPVARKGRK